ncbi:MAG: ATP-binding protein, partial [Verrucomicrobiota bacterium]
SQLIAKLRSVTTNSDESRIHHLPKSSLESDELTKLGESINRLRTDSETQTEELHEKISSESQLVNSLISNIQDGVWIISQDGRTVHRNHAFTQAFNADAGDNKSETQAIAQNLLGLFQESDELATWMGSALNSEKPPEAKEWQTVDEEYWYQISAAPVYPSRAKDRATLFLFRDISQQVTLEKRLSESRNLETIGNLSGSIAHEFNNILTGVIGNLEIAENSAAQPAAVEAIGKAHEGADRAVEIVQRMLSFSQRDWLHKKVVDSDKLRPDWAQFHDIPSGVSCSWSAEDLTWPVEVDELKVRRCIADLVRNAAEALPETGSIGITLKNHEELVVNNQNAAQNFVQLTVSDNGCGITRESVQQIFDPFFSTKEGHRGLGLSSCHGIITQHGGWMEVDSAPGTGTAIHAYLPAVTDQKVNIPESPNDDDQKQEFKDAHTVLVVDDDAMVRKVIEAILKRGGYTVITASSGREALMTYAKNPDLFDLVVLDLKMPEMMGTVVFEKLRADFPFVP